MVRQHKISRRYAKAICEILGDSKRYKVLASELADFAKLISEHKELHFVMCSEIVSRRSRGEIIDDLVKKLRLSDESRSILQAVSAMKRMKYLHAIAHNIYLMALVETNVAPLFVQTAGELNSNEKTKVEKRFETLLGKRVETTYEIDRMLIGGLRVTVAGKTYDGSVSGWLARLEDGLSKGVSDANTG